MRKVFAAQSKKTRLMNFSDVSVVVVVLIELTFLANYFFIEHEKRHPKVPWRLVCRDSNLHRLRHQLHPQLHPQRGAHADNRVKPRMRCGPQGFVERLARQA